VARPAIISDFERNIEKLLEDKLNAVLAARTNVQTQFIKAGGLAHSGYPVTVEAQSRSLLRETIAEAMTMVAAFCAATTLSYEQIEGVARNRLDNFAQNVANVVAEADRHMPGLKMSDVSRRYYKEVDDAFKDFEIGFIKGRPAMREEDTITGKSLVVLKELYDANAAAAPQLITYLPSASKMDEQTLQAVANYLNSAGLTRPSNLWFSLSLTAHGVNVIEDVLVNKKNDVREFAGIHANNLIIVQSMHGSAIQQGSSGSVRVGSDDLAGHLSDIRNLVGILAARIEGLAVDADEKELSRQQIAAVKAQLEKQTPNKNVIASGLRGLSTVINLIPTAVDAYEKVKGLFS
jgi:hypothetical protein